MFIKISNYSFIGVLITLLGANTLYAKDNKNPVFFGCVGIEIGGDYVSYEIEDESREAKLGGGLYVKLGLNTSIFKHIEGQFSVGYLFNAGTENKIPAYFAVPFEILGFYQFKQHRLGSGITFHCWPNVTACQANLDNSSDVDCSFNADLTFKNTMGLIIQYDYTLYKAVRFELRYTFIEFESGDIDRKVNGSGIGFALCTLF